MNTQWLAIALGGAVGAIVRFGVANSIYDWLGRDFPHGTLFINVSGSFLMGFLSVMLLQRFPLAVEYRAAILVGFLGAYTTFSTFALETLNLFETGNVLKAGLNILLSVVLCLAAVWVGVVLGRQLFESSDYPWLGDGLPYRHLGLGLALIFLLSAVVEYLCLKQQLAPQFKAVMLIAGLSLLTLISTLWLIFELKDWHLEFNRLLSVFLLNALSGVAAVWLGIMIGQWLWQLNLDSSQ